MARVNFSDNYVDNRITDKERRIAEKAAKKLNGALNEDGKQVLLSQTGQDNIDIGDQARLYATNLRTMSLAIDDDQYKSVSVQRYGRSHPTTVQLDPYKHFDTKKYQKAQQYALRKTHPGDGGGLFLVLGLYAYAAITFITPSKPLHPHSKKSAEAPKK